MNPEAAQVFFSLLMFVAIGLTIAAALPWLIRPWREPVWGSLVPLRLPIAAAVASTCMIGSLYFSEVANYPPCTLCWFQRIAMYSSAIILVIAAFRGDVGVRVYVIPLASVGMLVSVYHILVERFPDTFEKGDVCLAAIPCTTIWFERFGFITLPVMALVGFATIVAFLSMPEVES